MALTNIEAVRLKTSDQQMIHREAGVGDGETSEFKMELDQILTSPVPRVWKANVLLTTPAAYTIDLTNGIVTFVTIPAVNVELIFEYTSAVFTDAEVQFFLDEASGNTTLAAALNLFAWAASAAKLAKKETLAGGGGIGSVTLDLAVRSKELRESAKAYITQYQTLEGTGYAIDSITQVAWTSQLAEKQLVAWLLRDY